MISAAHSQHKVLVLYISVNHSYVKVVHFINIILTFLQGGSKWHVHELIFFQKKGMVGTDSWEGQITSSVVLTSCCNWKPGDVDDVFPAIFNQAFKAKHDLS